MLLPDVEVREPRVVLVELVKVWLVSVGLVVCETCQYIAKFCVCVGNGGVTWLGCWLLGMMMFAVAGCGYVEWFEVGGSRSVGYKGRLVVVKVLCSVAFPSSMGSRCPYYIAMSQE